MYVWVKCYFVTLLLLMESVLPSSSLKRRSRKKTYHCEMNGRLHCGERNTNREMPILKFKVGLSVKEMVKKLLWLRSVGDRELSTGHH